MKKIITLIMILVGSFSFQAQSQNDSNKKINWAAIPVVNYSNTTGASFGVMANAYYKVNFNDSISPSSSTGVFGMYTTNQTSFLAVFQRLYLNEDAWRMMLAFGTGNINSQYWQEFPIGGGDFIGFGTRAQFAMGQVEHKVFNNLYVGINATFIQSKTTFNFPDFFPDSLKYDKRNMNNLGFQVNYDKRDHQINPYKGFNIKLKGNFFREWMKSDNDFNKLRFTYNQYFTLKNEKNILATRFNAVISTGDVPFQGQNVVGQDDIRGYSSGRYRNDQVYAAQAEYRWRFHDKFGMVGFIGVASAVKHFDDIFNSELLPGTGAGFRYLMIPKERINIGVDFAKGKGDWGIYFRIGEAFGR